MGIFKSVVNKRFGDVFSLQAENGTKSPIIAWPLGLEWFGRLLAAELPDDCGKAWASGAALAPPFPQFAQAEGACNINYGIGSRLMG